MKNILICGFGNVGSHVFEELKSIKNFNVKISVFDPNIEKYKSINNKLVFDYTIICVPTEQKYQNGSVNLDEVMFCITKFKEVTDTFIIRSTVPVGTSDLIMKEYGINNIVFIPEFYGTTSHCIDQDALVIGGNPEHRERVCDLYNHVKNGYFHYIFTDNKTAELAKYMENCWIATKVTFCNEFANIASKFGINYNELRECWLSDKRISPSHTFVYPDQPFFNSHCLNKDIPALIYTCKNAGFEAPLIEKVLEIRNSNIKKN